MTEASEVYSATTEESNTNSNLLPISLEITYYIIGVVCIIGNSLTIVVIVMTMDITKTMTNCLILNQSIIDLFCGIFLILTTTFADFTRPMVNVGDLIYCKVWLTKGPMWGCFTSSTFNLVTITLERLIAIKYPIWYKLSMTRGKVIVASVLVWVLGNFVMVGYAIVSTSVISGQCSVYSIHPELGFPVVALQFFIPIIIFIVVYSLIALTLRKKVNPQGVEQEHIKRSRKIIVTLLKVVLCFVLCCSWNQMYYFFYLLNVVKIDFASRSFYHFIQFTVVALICNCCCNPIVYTLSYKKFQVGALKLFGCHQNSLTMDNTSGSHRIDNSSVNR